MPCDLCVYVCVCVCMYVCVHPMQLSALVWGLSGVGQPLPESVTEAVTEELYSRDWCACGPRDLLTLCNAFTRWHTTMSAQGADVGVRKQVG